MPRAILISALAFAVPTAAHAQDGPDILVEGTREVDGVAVRQQADEITQRPSTSSEPFARWQRPVCGGVYGLSFDNAVAVINRIHDVAALAGLEVDPDPECAANLWVIVVDDPAATFAQLRDEDGWMVRGLIPTELDRVEEQQGPVRAWNLASTRTEDGRPVPSGFDAVNLHQEQWQRVISGGEPFPWNNVWNMSRLRTSMRRDIDGSFVLVQRSALGSLDAYALADYAAMRVLARTQEPRGELTYATILGIFSQDMAPDRLTAFDRAYLRSIYQGNAFRPSRNGLPSLDELMEEELLREAGQLIEE